MFYQKIPQYYSMNQRGEGMFGLGVGELVLIALILMLFFGPKKLPQLGKGIGEAIREFKKSGKELTNNSDDQEKRS